MTGEEAYRFYYTYGYWPSDSVRQAGIQFIKERSQPVRGGNVSSPSAASTSQPYGGVRNQPAAGMNDIVIGPSSPTSSLSDIVIGPSTPASRPSNSVPTTSASGSTTASTGANRLTWSFPSYQQYTDPWTSLFTPIDFSMGVISPSSINASSAGSAATYSPYTIDMSRLGQLGLQIDPNTVGNVSAPSVLDFNINNYMNPWTQQVVQNTNAEIERQRRLMSMQIADAAARANAFGGDRHGVADSLTNERAIQQMINATAALNSAGYNEAMDLIRGDIANRMSADIANQNAGLNLGLANARLASEIALANMMSHNQAGQFNAAQQNQQSQFNANLQNLANMLNAQLSQSARQQSAQNYINLLGTAIGQNLALGNLALGDQKLVNDYLINSGLLGLNAYNSAANIANNSINADLMTYLALNGLLSGDNTRITTSPQSSLVNDLLGSLLLGYGLIRN